MRPCPICEYVPIYYSGRTKIFSMKYRIPDGWSLPAEINWYTCDNCGMIFGDGEMSQVMFDQYYKERYGYGVNSPSNTERLTRDALSFVGKASQDLVIVDFGGAGDDGKSIFAETLKDNGYSAQCVGIDDEFPADCDVIYASHVLEHIYSLPSVMKRICGALKANGSLIVDVPDATGLLQRWRMPILDFNTKHINHFTIRNLLELGYRNGFEATFIKSYEMDFAPCWQVLFKRVSTIQESKKHIERNIAERVEKLRAIDHPVNIWGMSDITWHLLSIVDLDVVNYIDNDPAYRGATYKGKQVLERPDNDAPIVILAQGQRGRLIENIRKMGIENKIVEV